MYSTKSSGPQTGSERELYSVLKRANLVQYYDIFIAQGGDDVSQLCEAGEEEFLDIMVLVGMASKPLHVRRLQKALQEWLTNPESFSQTGEPVTQHAAPSLSLSHASTHTRNSVPSSSVPSTVVPNISVPQQRHSPPDYLLPAWSLATSDFDRDFVSRHQRDPVYHVTPSLSPASEYLQRSMMTSASGYNSSIRMEKLEDPELSGPYRPMSDEQKRIIKETANKISSSLPTFEPKSQSLKRPIDKEIDELMSMPEDFPDRLDLIRRYSAIYGRFDSKRKHEKQLNCHQVSDSIAMYLQRTLFSEIVMVLLPTKCNFEMCINEAAAQLCNNRITLLSRRDDLFALARQVLREAGFTKPPATGPSAEFVVDTSSSPPTKQSRLDNSESFSQSRGNEAVAVNASNAPGANVPGSLVDVGLNFARQYGLDGLELELMKDVKQEPIISDVRSVDNRVLGDLQSRAYDDHLKPNSGSNVNVHI